MITQHIRLSLPSVSGDIICRTGTDIVGYYQNQTRTNETGGTEYLFEFTVKEGEDLQDLLS